MAMQQTAPAVEA